MGGVGRSKYNLGMLQNKVLCLGPNLQFLSYEPYQCMERVFWDLILLFCQLDLWQLVDKNTFTCPVSGLCFNIETSSNVD